MFYFPDFYRDSVSSKCSVVEVMITPITKKITQRGPRAEDVPPCLSIESEHALYISHVFVSIPFPFPCSLQHIPQMRHHSPLQFFISLSDMVGREWRDDGVVISSQASWKILVVEEEDIVTKRKPDKCCNLK